jgi:hypothetical protein
MTPDQAMNFAREDIAELRRAPTYSDCKTMHTPILGYCQALLGCCLISDAQQQVLIAEADAELAGWNKPTYRLHGSLTDIDYKSQTERIITRCGNNVQAQDRNASTC